MTKQEQYEVARVMTGSKTSNEVIDIQLATIDDSTRSLAPLAVHKMIQENSLPFNQVFTKSKSEFNQIATEHKIDSATLFCIYMQWRNK